VLLVDDGLATGASMRAAIDAVREQHPVRLVVAVPVGAAQTCRDLTVAVDEVVCAHSPPDFFAVGVHYANFNPIGDDAVQALLSSGNPAATT
jgi:predicted phosphoribosyltransferase